MRGAERAATAPWQPPLHWYSHVWRDLVCVLIGGAVWIPVMEHQAEGDRPLLFWVDLLLGIACLVLMHWRRRWPLPVAVIVLLATPFSSLAGGAITLTTISAATHRIRWQIVVLIVLNLAGTWAYYLIQPVPHTDPAWLVVVFTMAIVAASVAWGMFIGSRRELLWTLRGRAEAAEAERDLRAAQARTGERTRIAREMHDVLAHRISQISMHAGALTFREDLSADEMRASVAVIQDKAHEALTDLRNVLGVLRDEEGAPLTRPQPTYADLPSLVEETRAAGATIEYDDRLAGEQPVPVPVGRTAYRIVQEGVTNARKHAPGATIRITVTGSPDDGVHLVVRNRVGFGPTGMPGAGLGLVGLAERAELAGGRLEHGTEAGAFVLRAWLPWTS